MKGVDAPIANALRRILLADVPTVAFENVFYYNNTSIVQDEVLAHRLGLVPLRVDPHQLEVLATKDEESTDMNTIVFKLTAQGKAEKRSDAETAAMEGEDDAEGKYTKVYSSELEWVPQGDQEERFGEEWRPRPVEGDILLAKLAPGQIISLEAHAVKSTGMDHAKFSPVATASYRLLPAVTLVDNEAEEEGGAAPEPFFVDELAHKLKAACAPGVFDVEDMAGACGGVGAGARLWQRFLPWVSSQGRPISSV